MAAATLSMPPNRLAPASPISKPTVNLPHQAAGPIKPTRSEPWVGGVTYSRRLVAGAARAGSQADDSAPFDMSVESALKLLGVSEVASFDDILRAKNSMITAFKNDQEAVVQVEAAYDMLLMWSLKQRQAGKVADRSIRYADVRPVGTPSLASVPQWVESTLKNAPVSIEMPSTGELGIQAGVYGALMVLTYVNGASTSPGMPYSGADVPGLILASSFGASLYFMSRNNMKLGKAAVITIGGLVAGAVAGSAVENWLQVDIVPFLGIHSPASLVSSEVALDACVAFNSGSKAPPIVFMGGINGSSKLVYGGKFHEINTSSMVVSFARLTQIEVLGGLTLEMRKRK